MSRARLPALLTLFALAAGLGSAGAQPGPRGAPAPPPPVGPGIPGPHPHSGRMGAAPFGPGPPAVFPGEEQVPDFRKWLLGLNKKPMAKGLDPKVLKDLMERMDKLPKDQKADEKEIQELLNENPRFKDPAFLNQLEKLLESKDFPNNLERKLPEGTPPIQNDKLLGENLQRLIDQGKSDPVTPEGGPKPDPAAPPEVEPPDLDPAKADPKAASPAAENEWAKWLEKHFGDSPSGQAALKDLVSALEKQDTQGMFGNMPEFKAGAFKDFDTAFGKGNTPDLWKFKPPDLSGTKMTPPQIGGGPGGSSTGGGGSGFGGGGAGMSGGGTALAVMVGIAGAILLAALVLRKWKLDQAGRGAGVAAGKPGIDFDAIRTREELVRAFDHVSLDQMGEEARAWNHRVIADQIAEARPAQAEPAGELAGLYERARYAPLDEDLSAGEFADARRDLRAIAGVPA